MKKALILLNGLPPKSLPELSEFDIVCAVDGAYNYFEEHRIVPDIITGDFDSIYNIPDSIEIINTPNQDFTDFEKALHILFDRGISSISIYGGSGNESDHFLGNISVALAWKEKLNLRFFDEFGSYFFIPDEFKISNVGSKTVSLIPFPSTKGITTIGLEFPLTNDDLHFGAKIGTRNRAVSSEVHISFKSGNLLLYISH